MDININAKLHNKFEIEVRDAKTNKLKQTAFAYNVILNRYFQKMLNPSQSYPERMNPMTDMAVGSGTGTPSITDTGLFHSEITKSFYSDTTILGYPTSRRVITVKIESTECNGKNLTEVALRFYHGSTENGFINHAMIQDSEGQQIAIAKTDTDVVYITATFYVTLTNSGFGNNAVYPAANGSSIAQYLLTGTYFQYIYGSKREFQNANQIESKYTEKKDYYFATGTGDTANLRYTLPTITVLDSEWNNRTIKTVGFPGVGLFSLPDSSAFPDYNVDHTAIGIGDGTTTEFNIKCPKIKNGTVHVYVNTVEVPSSDYTIDYESNCCDSYENYYTAEMEALGSSGQVVFGDWATRTGTETVYDPFEFCYKEGFRKTNKPNYFLINSTNPIWIDFGTAKECNRIKITRNSPPEMKIEYSYDNEIWNTVSATSSSNVYSFDNITARYWRIYPMSGSWSPNLRNGYTLDSLDTGAFVFLGKTVPGLKFNTPPAIDSVIEASYKLDVPYKTSNNLLRIACTIQLQRG